MKVSAIVFDMDGTLVESNIDFLAIKNELKIPVDRPILEYVEEHFNDQQRIFANEVIHKYEQEACERSKEIRDISSFLNYLKSKKIPTGILTRNSMIIAKETLKRFNWDFDLVLTRDCAKAKPDPEGLEIFSNKFNIPMEEILYIGDYDFDVYTAINAGAIAGLLLNDKNDYLRTKAQVHITNYMDLIDKFDL